MAHIKEPSGIDFIIKSRPLTKEEEIAISEYILAYKEKSSTKLKVKQSKKLGTINRSKRIIKKKDVV